MTDCCSVCCENYSGLKRKKITCNSCEFEACRECVSRFLLEGTIESKCMNCKKPWDRRVLATQFSKAFVNGPVKEKREHDLFETEKALLPETQPYAMIRKDLAVVNKEIKELTYRLALLTEQRRRLEAGIPSSEHMKKAAIARLTLKCPAMGCRGFVDHETMQCGVCETYVCKECHEPLGQSDGQGNSLGQDQGHGHTCDPGTVETVKLLKKDTKNCPKCGVGIHKIEGCDQMYCTQCHTAFSWRTGEIVIGGRIHNPHYYEYMRRTGGGEAPREIGDIPCGGIPNRWDLSQWIYDPRIGNFHRILGHIEDVEIPRYRPNEGVAGNRSLRVDYINGDITEAEFKARIQKRAKHNEKCREISNVLNTCVVAGSDILRTLIQDRDSKKAQTSIQGLEEFTNEAMKEISKLYGCVVPVFVENGGIRGIKY